jgi:hypothetical protein
MVLDLEGEFVGVDVAVRDLSDSILEIMLRAK